MKSDEFFSDVYSRLVTFYGTKALLTKEEAFELHCRDYINRHAISDDGYLEVVILHLKVAWCFASLTVVSVVRTAIDLLQHRGGKGRGGWLQGHICRRQGLLFSCLRSASSKENNSWAFLSFIRFISSTSMNVLTIPSSECLAGTLVPWNIHDVGICNMSWALLRQANTKRREFCGKKERLMCMKRHCLKIQDIQEVVGFLSHLYLMFIGSFWCICPAFWSHVST